MIVQKFSLSVMSVTTPNGNTGSIAERQPNTGIESHIDYLVVCGNGYPQDVGTILTSVFGCAFDWENSRQGYRGQSYDCLVSSPLGIEIAYTTVDDYETSSNIRISIPGSPLSAVPDDRVFSLVKWLGSRGFHATRVDFAIDDFKRLLSLDDLASQCEISNFSGAREYRYYRRRKRGEYACGQTIYLGSSQSDKQVRIYDKSIESNGKINSIRFEAQWRRGRARAIFEQCFNSQTAADMHSFLCSVAVGAIRFGSAVVRGARPLPPCDTWDRFVARVGMPQKFRIPGVQPLLSKKLEWIEESVAPTLAMIIQCKGIKWYEHWIGGVIDRGFKRLGSAAAAFVATYLGRTKIEHNNYEVVQAALERRTIDDNNPLQRTEVWRDLSPIARTPQMTVYPTRLKSTKVMHQLRLAVVRALSALSELQIYQLSLEVCVPDTL